MTMIVSARLNMFLIAIGVSHAHSDNDQDFVLKLKYMPVYC